MKKHPKLGKILSYTCRLAALAAIFIVGVIAVFIAALGLSDIGVIDRGGALFYLMIIIIPLLAVIFLSWIFHRRNIKQTLIFWGITAIIGTVIAIPFVF